MVMPTGKLTKKDEMIAQLWKWLPWAVFIGATIPAPIVFLVLALGSNTPDVVAFYLVFALLSLGVGALIGLVLLLLLLVFRRRWFRQLRDKLAKDGITAREIPWFTSELTSAEREALADIAKQNPLLADAYCEMLATRLTATRIINRTRNEQLKVERRLNRARSISGADTTPLLSELQEDHAQLDNLRNEATKQLAQAKARLQEIEAAASRSLNQTETELMVRRLSDSQAQLPIAIELVRMEQEARKEAGREVNSTLSKVLDKSSR